MNWLEWLAKAVYAFNVFVLFYFVALNSIYALLFLVSLTEVFKFVRRTFFSDYRQILQSEMTWPISILVAAHDEEKTIVETVRSWRCRKRPWRQAESSGLSTGARSATAGSWGSSFPMRPYPSFRWSSTSGRF